MNKQIRARAFTGDFLEYVTNWYDNEEEPMDVIDWEFEDAPLSSKKPLTIIIEERMKEVEFVTCPHCNNDKLVKSSAYWDYDCIKCARGWKIDDQECWHSLGATDKETLTKEEVMDYQPHREIRREIRTRKKRYKGSRKNFEERC